LRTVLSAPAPGVLPPLAFLRLSRPLPTARQGGRRAAGVRQAALQQPRLAPTSVRHARVLTLAAPPRLCVC
jgi:hypothetical protein